MQDRVHVAVVGVGSSVRRDESVGELRTEIVIALDPTKAPAAGPASTMTVGQITGGARHTVVPLVDIEAVKVDGVGHHG